MRNCTGKRYSQSYLATIIGSSSCLVNFAVSLLLTNDDSGSARLLARVTGRSPSALLSLCKTRSSLRIFDVGASSARSELLGCGERLRIVRACRANESGPLLPDTLHTDRDLGDHPTRLEDVPAKEGGEQPKDASMNL